MGAIDILVHLSRREGLPRSISQALAAGKPVVAFDCDGAGEVCLDDQTGYLVPPGDLSLLQDRILRLVCDPELRRCLGEAGRKLVVENFSEEKMVREIFQLYRKLISGNGQPVKPRG